MKARAETKAADPETAEERCAQLVGAAEQRIANFTRDLGALLDRYRDVFKRVPLARPVAEHQILISGEQTADLVGRSVSMFAELRKNDPTFPKPVRVMANAHPQWIREEVVAWVLALPRVDDPGEQEPRDVWENPLREVRS